VENIRQIRIAFPDAFSCSHGEINVFY